MADSKDKQNENSTDDFADDLDAMLNDAESSMDEQDELIDDEDVIDRLLMDDEFSSDDPIDSTINESTSESMAEKQQDNSSDEFDIDDLIDSASTDKEEEVEVDEFADDDEFDVDSLLSSVAEENKDEFSEVEDEVVSTEVEKEVLAAVVEEETEDDFDIDDLINSATDDKDSEPASDDFLMADFDISSDDELLEDNESDDGDDELELETETPSLSEETNDSKTEESESVANLQNELNAQNEVTTQTSQELVQAKTAIDELKAQVSQVIADNEALKGLVTELTTATTEKDEAAIEEIDGLQKEQRKLKKSLKEGESKVPVITYIVMAIAILALFVGGGLGFVGYGASTDVEGLTEVVSTLEEEIEIVASKDATADIKEINFKINELKINDDGVDLQLAALKTEIQLPKANTLQAVVDDLVGQNEHAQQAIEKLLAAVETLEQKAVVSAATARKRAKRVVVKVEWVVNLVSFKQEWYAKRKAEEFKKKGILAKVEQVKMNGEKWYRLRVKGFKSKYEAAAYAVKVKKILNLSSVWVTKA